MSISTASPLRYDSKQTVCDPALRAWPVSKLITVTGDQLSFEEAVLGLKAYKEVQERMVQLWHNLNAVILAPRMDINNASPPSINVAGVRNPPCVPINAAC
jgi:centromere/kinetochore protein ZW10